MNSDHNSIPVLYSPYYDRLSPPRLIESVIYCHSEVHLLEFMDVGFKVRAKVNIGEVVASYGVGV